MEICAAMSLGKGSYFHSTETKTTNSSTEAELVGVSTRNFLEHNIIRNAILLCYYVGSSAVHRTTFYAERDQGVR